MKKWIVLALFFALWTLPLVAQPQVTVRARLDSDGVTYRYEVENTARRPIVEVMIGHDFTVGRSYLHALPEGWTENGIPAGTASVPNGWTADGFVEEDDRTFCLRFFATSEVDRTRDIRPGARAEGFRVRVESPDNNYLNGPVTVIFADGSRIRSWLAAQ